MILDTRMSALLAEIPIGKNLADIGADHGYVSVQYALNNKNNLVVGSDISASSIKKAQNYARKMRADNYITRVGDGTAAIRDLNIDVLLISGMGGMEIINILSNSPKYECYVLSPQRNVDCVRQYLSDNNIQPIKDYKIASGGKFYDIMVCKNGRYAPSEFELYFGSGKGSDFLQFKDKMMANLQSLMDKGVSDEKIKKQLQLLSVHSDERKL